MKPEWGMWWGGAMIGFAVGYFAGTAVASAMCMQYDEPLPVTLCYKGKCEQTKLTEECGNVFGAMSTYANGWTFVQGDTAGEIELTKETPVVIYRRQYKTNAKVEDFICKDESKYGTACEFFLRESVW